MIARRLEDAGQEVVDRLLERGDLAREAEDLHARCRVRLILQAIDQPLVEAGDQRVHLLRHLADHVGGLVGRLERGAPHALASLIRQIAEEFHEARDQVGLGEEGIDREIHLQMVVQLDQPRADGVGMRLHLHRLQAQDVLDADADQHAVDRLPGPVALEHLEEREPALTVGLGVGILRRVAAGGVDQHRFLGEQPVAIARAADALDLGGLGALGEREVQAGIDQRRRLTRARRADHDVPGQIVEIVALAAGRLLQGRQRILHRIRQLPAVVAGLGARHAGGQFLFLLGARVEGVAEVSERTERDERDREPAHQFRVEGAPVADRHQRQREENQQRDRRQSHDIATDEEKSAFLHVVVLDAREAVIVRACAGFPPGEWRFPPAGCGRALPRCRSARRAGYRTCPRP